MQMMETRFEGNSQRGFETPLKGPNKFIICFFASKSNPKNMQQMAQSAFFLPPATNWLIKWLHHPENYHFFG